jgi:hypothetical protein
VIVHVEYIHSVDARRGAIPSDTSCPVRVSSITTSRSDLVAKVVRSFNLCGLGGTNAFARPRWSENEHG